MLNRPGQYIWLFLIITVGAVMRFYQYAEFSLTNDELSAIFRSLFPSFGEMIEKGVIATDPHPAGTQIFLYYWIKWFGMEAGVVRFPFILLSILSIGLGYLIGNQWFGKNTGLFVAAAIAILKFPVLFGQLARPYGFGFFFSLLMVYAWTRALFDKDRRIWPWIVYTLSAVFCCYSHYFSGLFAMVVGVTGLFFLRKETWKPYVLSNAIVALLFIPHIGITLHQMKVGGLSGWLPPPESDFLWKHLLFLMNESAWLWYVTIFFTLSMAWLSRRSIRLNRFQVISLLWFLLPIVIGYVYSQNHATVLMDRVLLFTFPYLFLLLFSFIGDGLENNKRTAVLGIFLLVGIYSTAFKGRIYEEAQFEDFKTMAEKLIEWDEQYGSDLITKTINLNSPAYIEYYLQRLHPDYQSDFKMNMILNDSAVAQLSRVIDKSDRPYFISGWACIYHPYEVPELIKQQYPVIVDRVQQFNMEITLYGKGKGRRNLIPDTYNGFETLNPSWSLDSSYLDTNQAFDGQRSFRIPPSLEYGPTYRTTLAELLKSDANTFTFSLHAFAEKPVNALLVMSFDRQGEQLSWHSVELKEFLLPHSQWYRAIISRKIPEGALPDDGVSVYVWNPEKDELWIDNLLFSTFKDSEYHYYE